MSSSTNNAQPKYLLSEIVGFHAMVTPFAMGIGTLAARVFTTLNPLAGGIIMGVATISSLAATVTASCFTKDTTSINKTGSLFSFVGALAFSDMALKAFGFSAIGAWKVVPILLGSVAVCLGTVPAAIAAAHLLPLALSVAILAGTIALGIKLGSK